MPNRLIFLASAGLGAMAMYYFDPSRGRYRRSLARDQLVHASHRTQRGLRAAGRDLRNRAVGTTAVARSFFDVDQPDDRVLAERVHACVGRMVSHPGSIEVVANSGTVTLAGPILRHEMSPLIGCVLGVRGVKGVRNQLDVHTAAGREPGLQGEPGRRLGRRPEFFQTNWSPGARVVGGLAGAAAVVFGLARRGPGGALLGVAGALVLARAATNREVVHLIGLGPTHHTVDVQKSIRIHAPVQEVFQLWENVESFPYFMTHVRQVRPLASEPDEMRWRWTVRGSSGLEFEFDSLVTEREENRLLAWRSEPEALFQHAGRVRFQENDDGSTTVDVKMSFESAAGSVGRICAKLLGADPKRQMNDDLMRMKAFLETGKAPHDAAVKTAAHNRRHAPERKEESIPTLTDTAFGQPIGKTQPPVPTPEIG